MPVVAYEKEPLLFGHITYNYSHPKIMKAPRNYMSDNTAYYKDNNEYTNHLDTQGRQMFTRYISTITAITNPTSKILDVGCGSGIVLEALYESGRKATGLEISKTSALRCNDKGLSCLVYDGKGFPVDNGCFDVVGSFNVMEHTADPSLFLDEQYRVVRKGGYIVIACPNFLSITNNYHWHTHGLARKLKNTMGIVKRTMGKFEAFEMMPIVESEYFHSDDDACVVTNPQDILKWAERRQLKLIKWSSQHVDLSNLANMLDKSIMRVFLGGCFMVFEKQE